MKVLHLQPELNITCGVSKAIYTLTRNASSEVDNFIVTLGGDGIERFNYLGERLILLNYKKSNIFYTPIIFLNVLRICIRKNIDIIHSHHRYFDLMAYLISKLKRIKTVTTVHSMVRGYENISYKSDIIISVSNSIKNHLINQFSIKERKIKVIHNFVLKEESTHISDKNNIGIFLPDNSLNVVFIGRFDDEKGIDILLKAFLSVQNSNPKLYLILVGSGSKEKFVKDFIKGNNLSATVVEPRYDIFDIYKIADLVVLPSRVDPFPLVMLEAGLMKLPFIGSNVDGIAEVIVHESNGLLFEKENIGELSGMIEYMTADINKAKQYGINLYNDVINNYLAEKGIASYKKVYTELLLERNELIN